MRIPGYEIRLIGDISQFINSGASLLTGRQESVGGVEGRDVKRQVSKSRWRPQDHGEQAHVRPPRVERGAIGTGEQQISYKREEGSHNSSETMTRDGSFSRRMYVLIPDGSANGCREVRPGWATD